MRSERMGGSTRRVVIVSAGRVHEPLGFDVAVPNASESLNVSHFGRPDVHLAVLTDEHRLAVTADVILLNADGMPLAGSDLENNRA
jgi:hypothetical protein